MTNRGGSPAFYLHVISFDVPFPPNYGGIIEVYYKLLALHQAGVKIIYHCFFYKGHNEPSAELEKYCEKVHYYPRRQSLMKAISRLPYTVVTRNNTELLENLKKDHHPIFFEGLQTCFFLNHPALSNRKKYVRAHNIEHLYYQNLASAERRFFRRFYLKREAKKLQRFEKALQLADGIFPLAKMDLDHFSRYAKSCHIPPFFKNAHTRDEFDENDIPIAIGSGRYILFHGNLAVPENEKAAAFILTEIVPLVPHPVIIAGSSPSAWLVKQASATANARLIPSPDTIRMDALIRHAHINLLLTFQQTGVKLKLLHALESGKHVIINSLMDDAGIFAEMCHVQDQPYDISKKINELIKVDFSAEDAKKRMELFSKRFNNAINAARITDVIFS